MNTILKLSLAVCLITCSVIATSNEYTCAILSLNDDDSWNIENPIVLDDNVTLVSISAKCGDYNVDVKSNIPEKAALNSINGDVVITFEKNGRQISEAVSYDDFEFSQY